MTVQPPRDICPDSVDQRGYPYWPDDIADSPDSPQSIRADIHGMAGHTTIPPPPKCTADPSQQFDWLRRYVRTTALDAVVLCADASCPECTVAVAKQEITELAVRAEYSLGYGVGLGRRAAESEWQAAKQNLTALGENIRRSIWSLIKTHAPGEQIIGAASRRAAEIQFFIPRHMIIALCREATQGVRKHG